MYEPGNYWCKVTNQQLSESKEKKTPQWVLSFTVIGKVDPKDPQGALLSCPQYERSIFRVITDATVDYLIEDVKRLCDRAGVEPTLPSFAYLDPAQPGYLDFTNVEFEGYCKHDSYNGKTREQWGISRGAGGLEVAKLDDKGIRQLDALFGKHLKAMGGGVKPASRQAPMTAASQPAADRKAGGIPPEYRAEAEASEEIPF